MSTLIQRVGVGLRQAHYAEFLSDSPPDIEWLEILSDNYLWTKGVLFEKILKIRERYPMVMHGVGLNIGSMDPLNKDYLMALKKLANSIEPAWISDHLCWTGAQGYFSHDLLPLPYTQECLNHVASRLIQVQETLQRSVLLENVSSYYLSPDDEFSEAEFIRELVKKTGCAWLLDVNNIAVNAHNHGFSTDSYLASLSDIPVKQIHLAGYEVKDDVWIDTHGSPVFPQVWELYEKVLQQFGPVPTNIEWDNQVPDWTTLYAEVCQARKYYDQTI